MKKWFKRVAISLAALLMVAVVGAAVFLLTFDPNAYKYQIGEAMRVRYDRTLTIDGEIELSFFPRLGLTVQGLSLSEAGRPNEEFISIDSARVAVAIWPLLFRQWVLEHVAIDGFRAQVVRGADGHFNFQDLMNTAWVASPALGQVDAGVAASRNGVRIDVAGLDLYDGEVFFRDEHSASAVRVVEINASTGRMAFDRPFDMAMSARIEGEAPRIAVHVTGQAILGGANGSSSSDHAIREIGRALKGVLKP